MAAAAGVDSVEHGFFMGQENLRRMADRGTVWVPTAFTMKAYSDASDQIMEIERALSLGKKASVDTGMRKLQSLARNNVQTNYGNRLSLARELEDAGGVSLLPSIARQARNSWTPRT